MGKNYYKFKMYKDCTDIKDSMQLDSGTHICSLSIEDYEGVTAKIWINVCGEVSVWWNKDGIKDDFREDELYHYPSEFPTALKELIAKDPSAIYGEDDRVWVSFNNWFEIFYEDADYLESDVIDCEGMNEELLFDSCINYFNGIQEWIKEKKNG